MLVAKKDDIEIYWFCNLQRYEVYKKGSNLFPLLVARGFKYSDVKTWVE